MQSGEPFRCVGAVAKLRDSKPKASSSQDLGGVPDKHLAAGGGFAWPSGFVVLKVLGYFGLQSPTA